MDALLFFADLWLNVLLIGWALADIFRHPMDAWREAKESRASWMVTIALGALLGATVSGLSLILYLGALPVLLLGNFGALTAAVYLARIRPRLRSASGSRR